MIENRTQVVITTYQCCPLCTAIKVKDVRDVFAVLGKAITDIADPSLSPQPKARMQGTQAGEGAFKKEKP